MLVPAPATSAGSRPRMVAWVATGMNTGVGTGPRRVWRTPAGAPVGSTAVSSNPTGLWGARARQAGHRSAACGMMLAGREAPETAVTGEPSETGGGRGPIADVSTIGRREVTPGAQEAGAGLAPAL